MTCLQYVSDSINSVQSLSFFKNLFQERQYSKIQIMSFTTLECIKILEILEKYVVASVDAVLSNQFFELVENNSLTSTCSIDFPGAYLWTIPTEFYLNL